MNDLLNRFSEAAKAISTSKSQMWDRVRKAFVDHLSDINTDSLPEEIQIFYDSVKLRVTSVEVFGQISNEEASYIAKDISYMADVINSCLKSSKKEEAIF